MRAYVAVSIGLAAFSCVGIQACSSNSGQQGFLTNPDGGSSSSGSSGGGSGSSGGGSSGGSSGSSSGSLAGDGGGIVDEGGDGSITVVNTIYAHTDETLYSVDPQTMAVTVVGPFAGTSDSSTDSVVTDLAVDSNHDVYVNTESVVYKAALPATSPGTVTLTKVATIQGTAKFYALAFAPVGSLDPNIEVLIGGDSNGALWSIDTTSGATVNLGTFGAGQERRPPTPGRTSSSSPATSSSTTTSSNNPTGLATIRSCPAGKSNSDHQLQQGLPRVGRHDGAEDRLHEQDGVGVAARRHLRRADVGRGDDGARRRDGVRRRVRPRRVELDRVRVHADDHDARGRRAAHHHRHDDGRGGVRPVVHLHEARISAGPAPA